MAADPNFWQERWSRVIGTKEYAVKARTEDGPVAINDATIFDGEIERMPTGLRKRAAR